mmetsp:Transcript_129303/g.374427  ORF Transcript_129303/g.374427 Transcript_129303/m.374427 type:complete len:234 (+) Transcript_129303:283-984(+)
MPAAHRGRRTMDEATAQRHRIGARAGDPTPVGLLMPATAAFRPRGAAARWAGALWLLRPRFAAFEMPASLATGFEERTTFLRGWLWHSAVGAAPVVSGLPRRAAGTRRLAEEPAAWRSAACCALAAGGCATEEGPALSSSARSPFFALAPPAAVDRTAAGSGVDWGRGDDDSGSDNKEATSLEGSPIKSRVAFEDGAVDVTDAPPSSNCFEAPLSSRSKPGQDLLRLTWCNTV